MVSQKQIGMIEQSLEDLRHERCSYLARAKALVEQRGPEADAALRGYLNSIENINAAMIRLARMGTAQAL